MKEVNGQDDPQQGDHQVSDYSRIGSITFRDFNRLQGLKHPAVLYGRICGNPRTQQDESQSRPERDAALQRCSMLGQDDVDKQPESLNDKAERHQRKAGAVPGEERPLSGEKNSGVVEI